MKSKVRTNATQNERKAQMNILRRTGWLWAFAVTLSVGSAQACFVEALTVEDLTVHASDVVIGKVIDIESKWQGKIIVSEVRVSIEECFKGVCADREIVVQKMGGEIDDLVMHVDVSEEYELDERVLLFLEPVSIGSWRTTAMSQGKFRVVDLDGEPVAVRFTHDVNRVGPKKLSAQSEDVMPVRRLIERLSVVESSP